MWINVKEREKGGRRVEVQSSSCLSLFTLGSRCSHTTRVLRARLFQVP